ncbi:SDR family oxidoreductase [Nocardioidaceae bacterium]|nr:SDR family oxidoreductase [Nocardioidaceae bacterium]
MRSPATSSSASSSSSSTSRTRPERFRRCVSSLIPAVDHGCCHPDNTLWWGVRVPVSVGGVTATFTYESEDLAGFGLDAFSLAGRTALVTGGNTGLGRAFSVALARAGADVHVVSLLADDGTTRELVKGCGRRYVETIADLTEPGACDAAVAECVERLGALDVLVNSAGMCLTGGPEEFDREPWDRMVAVNLTAAFELARAAGRHMVARGSGRIINIASLFSYLGGQGSPAYAATKHGIVGFTKAYCDELAGHGIGVNAIAPGYYATALTERSRADEVTAARILDHIPAGRWGDPRDLMGALVFLASDASAYVNGHTLVVDGGYLVR